MNNKIFISFVLCSRKRPDRLLKLIDSVYKTCHYPNEIEFYIKFDDDDNESISRIEEYKKYPNVKIKIAPRMNGYISIDFFLDQMANESTGEWIFFANDDMYFIGDGWDSEIKKIEKQNCIVYPNKHQLGPSIYENAPNMAFFFIPNRCWQKHGCKQLYHPYDAHLNRLLLYENNYKDIFINLQTVHDRDEYYLLEKHRKL